MINLRERNESNSQMGVSAHIIARFSRPELVRLLPVVLRLGFGPRTIDDAPRREEHEGEDDERGDPHRIFSTAKP